MLVATCQGLFNQNHLFSSDFLLSSLSIILVSLSCIVSVAFSLIWNNLIGGLSNLSLC